MQPLAAAGSRGRTRRHRIRVAAKTTYPSQKGNPIYKYQSIQRCTAYSYLHAHRLIRLANLRPGGPRSHSFMLACKNTNLLVRPDQSSCDHRSSFSAEPWSGCHIGCGPRAVGAAWRERCSADSGPVVPLMCAAVLMRRSNGVYSAAENDSHITCFP